MNDCVYMHKSYPCKYYHLVGRCYAGEACKLSHDDLSTTDSIRTEILETLKESCLIPDDEYEIKQLARLGIEPLQKPPPGIGILPNPTGNEILLQHSKIKQMRMRGEVTVEPVKSVVDLLNMPIRAPSKLLSLKIEERAEARHVNVDLDWVPRKKDDTGYSTSEEVVNLVKRGWLVKWLSDRRSLWTSMNTRYMPDICSAVPTEIENDPHQMEQILEHFKRTLYIEEYSIFRDKIFTALDGKKASSYQIMDNYNAECKHEAFEKAWEAQNTVPMTSSIQGTVPWNNANVSTGKWVKLPPPPRPPLPVPNFNIECDSTTSTLEHELKEFLAAAQQETTSIKQKHESQAADDSDKQNEETENPVSVTLFPAEIESNSLEEDNVFQIPMSSSASAIDPRRSTPAEQVVHDNFEMSVSDWTGVVPQFYFDDPVLRHQMQARVQKQHKWVYDYLTDPAESHSTLSKYERRMQLKASEQLAHAEVPIIPASVESIAQYSAPVLPRGRSIYPQQVVQTMAWNPARDPRNKVKQQPEEFKREV